MKPAYHFIYVTAIAASFIAGRVTMESKISKEMKNSPSRGIASLGKQLLGTTEVIALEEENGIRITAKVDSGAESSSLHAINIRPFEKDSVQYVTFDTVDDSGSVHEITRQVIKQDSVKNANGSTFRFFVLDTVWVGGQKFLTEVTLADRSSLKRKFLIGKKLLDEGQFLVDVSNNEIANKALTCSVER